VLRYYKKNDTYTITSCENDDIDDLRVFFNDYWMKDHIIFIDREFLEWQYHNERYDNYNFIIARENATGEIIGQAGFIPNYIFDYSIDGDEKFIWFSTWRLRTDKLQSGSLGIELLTAIPIIESTNNTGVPGIFESVAPLYKAMKYDTGCLDHFFVINEDMRGFNIADIPEGYSPIARGIGASSMLEVIKQDCFEQVFSEVMGKDRISFPKKTKEYFINRYYNHPIYKYEALLVRTGGEPVAVLMFRTAKHDGATALRIVDGFGDYDSIGNIYEGLQKLLSNRGSEYIDIYCKGVSTDILINAGFTAHTISDDIVIPNFFEPFVRENKNIYFAFYNKDKRPYTVFKADGDQDRPNVYHVRNGYN